MIKKFFHYLCVIVAWALWAALLAGAVHLMVMFVYHTNPIIFYRSLSLFWNQGYILQGKDLAIVVLILLMIPLFLYGCYRLYGFQYMKLLTVPLNKFFNSGLEGYVAPDVNIKNLKIEEKKSLDQFIQERLDKEKKKVAGSNAADFRKGIIEKIQEAKK